MSTAPQVTNNQILRAEMVRIRNLINLVESRLQVAEQLEHMVKPSPSDVVNAVCLEYRMTRQELTCHTNVKAVCQPRHVAVYLLRTACPDMSYPVIGRLLGGFHHTTIMNAERQVKRRMQADPVFARRVSHIAEALKLG